MGKLSKDMENVREDVEFYVLHAAKNLHAVKEIQKRHHADEGAMFVRVTSLSEDKEALTTDSVPMEVLIECGLDVVQLLERIYSQTVDGTVRNILKAVETDKDEGV